MTNLVVAEAKREDALNADELDVTSNPSDTVHGTTVKKNIDDWSSDNKDSNTIPKTESKLRKSDSTKLYIIALTICI